MRSGTIAFLVGIVSLQSFAALPAGYWTALLPLAVAGLRWPRLRLAAAGAAGLLWALAHSHWIVAHDWPTACEGKDVLATGTILSIPAATERHSRFEFRVEALEGCPSAGLPVRLRIGWYGVVPPLRAGDRWQLHLRVKARNGFFNRGGFDYERWLLQQRIGGSGYVREADDALRMSASHDPASLLQGWRQRVHDALQARLPPSPAAALVLALALGERTGIDASQWQVLRGTGTSHLVAISGLHVGLAAGFGWLLGLWGWKRSAYLCGLVPAQRAAAVPALVCGVTYAALAGFSVPTQRALVMLAVGLLALLAQRQPTPARAWFIALLAVLLLDPLAVLSAGFWLSFGAVAVLLFGMGARWSPRGVWWRWGRAQWLVGIGLVPLTLGAFQTMSVAGPVANLLAVPWVSLVVVPLVLVGTLFIGLMPGLAAWLLGMACSALDLLWPLLAWLAALPFATVFAAPSLAWLPLAGLGVVWLLAPRGFPARPVGLLLVLPLWSPPGETIREEEALLTLLDVGQGLSAVVRTRNQVLVYDTGPRFGPDFDAGEAVLLPYLRHLGVKNVDTVVLSHNDGDHVGGFDSLRAAIGVGDVLAGQPAADGRQRPCRAGTRWHADGIRFELLHPPPELRPAGNNGSCVLRIVSPGGSVLLAGDLQHRGERALLATGTELASDILVAPHHGSGTSSSSAFVEAVTPRWVLFATGYRNRFGFPRPEVVARYRAAGARVRSTAQCGAIFIRLSPGKIPAPICARQRDGRYWNRR